jgi:hydroxyacylglutathione hydrolase
MSFAIHGLPALKDNYIYVLTDRARGEAAVIDPGDAGPVQAFLQNQNLKLTDILCTHHHPDHVAGAVELARLWSAPVTCSRFDLGRIAGAVRGLSDGESLTVLGEIFQAITVPGHTDGQISLWCAAHKALFVGDTLFSGGCGRLFEGSFAQMFSSLQKIKSLPLDTKIYFGHEYTLRNMEFILEKSHDPGLSAAVREYQSECQLRLARGGTTTPTTLERELQINPFLKAQTVEEFTHWREARNQW